jgi:phosphoenolpyruvate carboxykinase (ATP)
MAESVAAVTLAPAKPAPAPQALDLVSDDGARNTATSGRHPGQRVLRNPPVALLYEEAVRLEHETTQICANGALAAMSGAKTGRSPQDKRIVEEPSSAEDVWWGPVNIKLDQRTFLTNRERAIDFLNMQPQLYVIDAYAGWDLRYRMKVRVVCSRAYHALFMWDMLIRPTPAELAEFGEPDFTIYNAGCFPANRFTQGMTSASSIAIDLSRNEMVILGTEYAGEMKKGILTVMMYWMPKRGQLCLHASANQSGDGRTTLFFGLSGTGKTTLSADPKRALLGDDEFVWTDDGVFNIEGGCYAKCINLSREQEPEIYDAIRYGAVVENVVVDEGSREIDFGDMSITENTRCAYPLQHIPNARLPAIGPHPTNIILLTCDAFGVLPPVARLDRRQVMYQFISGYTAKVAGTETGVKTPIPTFSPCFGGPFLVWHPVVYAKMLARKLEEHNCDAWLVNTGWVGGTCSDPAAHRIRLRYTRCMVDAVNSGELRQVATERMPGFGFQIPVDCPGVPADVLRPWRSWRSMEEYRSTVNRVAAMFRENWAANYARDAGEGIALAAPRDWDDAQL